MQKINYLLSDRLDAVKKQAEKWAAHNPAALLIAGGRYSKPRAHAPALAH